MRTFPVEAVIGMRRSDAEIDHRVGHLAEPGDVGAHDIIVWFAEFGGGVAGGVMDVDHDLVQPAVGLFAGPGETHGVLAHFKSAGGDAAGVGRLAGGEEHAVGEQEFSRIERRRHVGAFADADAAAVDQRFSLFEAELVLGGAGHGDFGLGELPGAASFVIERGRVFLGVLGEAPAPDVFEFHDIGELLLVDAVLVDHRAVRIGERDHPAAELGRLLGRILRDVAGAGDQHAGSFESAVAGGEHFGREIDRAVAGRLRADQASAPVESLAGEHAVIAVDDPLVLAEEVADFARADADVAGRNVGGGADVAVEFAHEAMAEGHDLVVGFSLGVEVRAAFAAAHRQRGQAVLEHLLEAEEFQDRQIHRRVEAKSPLVRSDRAVELDAVTGVDLDFSLVVDPRNLKHDRAFRNDHTFEHPVFLVLRLRFQQLRKRAEHLGYALDELLLNAVGLLQSGQDAIDIVAHFTDTFP